MAKGWRVAAALAAVAAVAGCASVPDRAAPSSVGLFSTGVPGGALPAGWRPWTLSALKKPTEYELVSNHGTTVVRASAVASASGLVHPLDLDPRAYPLLNWRWRVDDLIEKADNTRKHTEDSPLRILVSFRGDVEKLPLSDRIFFDNMRLLTGHRMPYATLVYIWENRAPVGTVIPNLHTPRVKMIVARSGPDGLGAWQDVTRNVVEDFRRAFGEEPGPVTSVGIMTDTDNTGTEARGYYGDIAFRPARLTIATE